MKDKTAESNSDVPSNLEEVAGNVLSSIIIEKSNADLDLAYMEFEKWYKICQGNGFTDIFCKREDSKSVHIVGSLFPVWSERISEFQFPNLNQTCIVVVSTKRKRQVS